MAIRTVTATIPAGSTISAPIDCTGSNRIVRLIMPSAWTAAPLTFCVSPDNTTYHDLYGTAADHYTTYEVTVPVVTANSAVTFPIDTGADVSWFKVRSGNHAVPVNQAADRVFQVVLEMPDDIAGGAAGPTGPAGSSGAVGATGPAGPAGAVGATGPTGALGGTGPAGAVGASGASGAQGPAGAAGPTGVIGPTGLQGVTGPAGQVGAQGATGPTGTFNLKGVTDGSDAAAGNIGEYLSATVLQAAAKAANTGVNADVVTLSLPAGDWDVQGQVWIAPTGTTRSTRSTRETLAAINVTGLAAWVSKTSVTLPTVPAGSLQSFFGINIALTANLPVLTSGRVRFSLSAPTTIYLSGQVTFTGAGPIGLYGFVGARRMR
jgi:hypothetical protein